MPVKFKIYNAFAIYVSLWALCFLGFIVYMSILEPPPGKVEIIGIIVVSVTLLCCIVKAPACLVMLRHLKRTTAPGKAGRIFFIVLFGTNILFVIIDSALAYFIIRGEMKDNGISFAFQMPVLQLLLLISMVLSVFTAIFLAIFDVALLKTVTKNYRETLLTFEAGTN